MNPDVAGEVRDTTCEYILGDPPVACLPTDRFTPREGDAAERISSAFHGTPVSPPPPPPSMCSAPKRHQVFDMSLRNVASIRITRFSS